MVPPGDDDHDCGWKAYAEDQSAKLAELSAKLEELQRRVFGKKSERRKSTKLPPPLPVKATVEETAKKRSDAAELRAAKLETEVVPVAVPPEQCTCPDCGNELRRVGNGKPSTVYTYVQPYFRKRIYQRETRSCRCGHIVTAPAPLRVGEKTRYAPSFVAHLIVGCLAHARRKIYEQREHPETKEALDLIADIYRVEARAKAAGIVGTDEHLALRREKSRPIFARLLQWGRRHRGYFEPRSGMGRAIGYLLRNFRELGRFLRYASIPPDNNIAEASLRRVALGRSNYLFFGNEEAGNNFAVLYTLVASCEKNGVNAIDYLADVMIRVHTHPPQRIEELLPHRWKPPDSGPD